MFYDRMGISIMPLFHSVAVSKNRCVNLTNFKTGKGCKAIFEKKKPHLGYKKGIYKSLFHVVYTAACTQ